MSAVMTPTAPAVDFAAVKTRQQAAWSAGNYAVVGTTLQIVGENLCEALDLRSGSRVLDVAAGNGNATLAAARRWCEVTSTDYVPSLLTSGHARALAEGHTVHFQEADAENLPFADAAFDVVMSTFGVMFTPNQAKGGERAGARLQTGRQDWSGQLDTRELHRPGVQDHRQVHTARARRPVARAMGHQDPPRRTLRQDSAGDPRDAPRFRLPLSFGGALDRSVPHVLRPDEQDLRSTRCRQASAFNQDLLALIASRNRSGDGTLVLPSEYLEVVLERKW